MLKDKIVQLDERLKELGIKDEDIVEKFIQGSGKGGQKVNKTSSCVYLKHLPTGLEVKCQKERSRTLNRFYARRLLADKYAEIILKQKTKKVAEQEKIRRQKKRRTRRMQEKTLEGKRTRSEIKKKRSTPEE